MGCGDECPYIPGKRYLGWELPDPKGRPLAEVRRTRDEIERRVTELLGELGDGPLIFSRAVVVPRSRAPSNALAVAVTARPLPPAASTRSRPLADSLTRTLALAPARISKPGDAQLRLPALLQTPATAFAAFASLGAEHQFAGAAHKHIRRTEKRNRHPPVRIDRRALAEDLDPELRGFEGGVGAGAGPIAIGGDEAVVDRCAGLQTGDRSRNVSGIEAVSAGDSGVAGTVGSGGSELEVEHGGPGVGDDRPGERRFGRLQAGGPPVVTPGGATS